MPDFSPAEIEYYRSMVTMIIGTDDPHRKKSIDENARLQVAAVRKSLPDSGDGVLVTFMVSVAFIMAKMLSSPLQSVPTDMESVFNNNIVGAAVVMGAYDPGSADIPRHDAPSGDDGKLAAEIEDIISRQYL